MALTPAQKTTLKSAILADGTLNAFPNTGDGNFDLAAKLSTELASPNFTVWRTTVPIAEVGDAIVATEIAGLTAIRLQRLSALSALAPNGVNASLQDRRDGYGEVFAGAGGTATTTRLNALWRRLAKRIEKILATGTGSDPSPATMGYEGVLSGDDVTAARNS